jgi:hypothetical protein
MKQKFMLEKNCKRKELTIREFLELEENEYSLLCEERFDSEAVESAINKGRKFLVPILRTHNIFPPRLQIEKIAESVTRLYENPDDQSIELIFDDKEFLLKK